MKLAFTEDGSSFATHSGAFFRDWSFLLRVCSSVSYRLFACVTRGHFKFPISQEDVVISIGVVCMSHRTWSWIFSVDLRSNPERKQAVVLIEPAMCAFLQIICNTELHAFHSDGAIAFVWKNRVTDSLSVRMIACFVASHRKCANSRSSKKNRVDWHFEFSRRDDYRSERTEA